MAISVYSRDGVGKFSLATNIPLNFIPTSLAVTPNGEHLLACDLKNDGQDGQVMLISARTFAIINAFTTLQYPLDIAITPSSDYIFVCCLVGITLIGYDYKTGKYVLLEKDLGVCKDSETICISQKTNQVFVGNLSNPGKLSSVNMITYEKANSISNFTMQPTSALADAGGTRVIVWQNPRILSDRWVAGIEVIDTVNYTTDFLLVDFAFYDMVYSADNTLLYVIRGLNNVITVDAIDATNFSGKETVAGLAGTPLQLLLTAEGNSLIVLLSSDNDTKNSIAFVRTSDMKITDTIQLQVKVEGALPMVALPDSSKIFISQRQGLSVLENTGNGYALMGNTITLNSTLHSLAAHPDGNRIFGIVSDANTIYDINTSTYECVEMQIPNAYSSKLGGLAVSPDGSEIVVSTNDKGGILFLNTDSWTPIFGRAIGQLPICPIYLPDASQIFVTRQNGVGIMKQVQAG